MAESLFLLLSLSPMMCFVSLIPTSTDSTLPGDMGGSLPRSTGSNCENSSCGPRPCSVRSTAESKAEAAESVEALEQTEPCRRRSLACFNFSFLSAFSLYHCASFDSRSSIFCKNKNSWSCRFFWEIKEIINYPLPFCAPGCACSWRFRKPCENRTKASWFFFFSQIFASKSKMCAKSQVKLATMQKGRSH